MPVRNKALIIGIDGCRPDALLAANTPHMDALIADGAFSDQAQTGEYTISGPCWADMLTGVWYTKHGVRDNSFDGARFDAYPHFFRRIKERRPDLVTASIVNWEPINGMILSHADYAQAYPTDAAVAEATVRYLQEATPDVLFIQFDEVDASGHRHGFAPTAPGYLETIARTDALIGIVLEALRKRRDVAQENWLVVVSTDHGGSERGHGQNIPAHRTIFLIVNGGGARGPIIPEPAIVVVPPTVAAHLGVPVDPAWGWEGESIKDEG
jgi:predicted AlkP superfamily pyrophosphatase or phosphodiesterase